MATIDPTKAAPQVGPSPAHAATADPAAPAGLTPALTTRDLNVWYGSSHSLRDVNLAFPRNRITALIGPSGCGKSTLLRCFNRMNDLIPAFRMEGEIRFDGELISSPDVDAVALRRRVGMVFQKPNPFPKTIYQNVAWGARINGYRGDMDELVERSLRRAALWNEVKHKLHTSGLDLSGGQQQRLCIARTLAVEPEVILMDEPCSALDPIATARIEELIDELRAQYCIIIVTHSMAQAARVSQRTAFFHMGRLVEAGPTGDIFTRPGDSRTQDYITGRFG